MFCLVTVVTEDHFTVRIEPDRIQLNIWFLLDEICHLHSKKSRAELQPWDCRLRLGRQFGLAHDKSYLDFLSLMNCFQVSHSTNSHG